VTEVNPALCQGCGVCIAACPAGAISGTGFSDAQILGQIEGSWRSASAERGVEAVPA
jgi:heterodisulfide reductase subunit A